MASEFEMFWDKCPVKKARLLAEKAYVKARKRATAQELLDGMDRYVENKPGWQEYAYPATWLNQGRWLDEAPVARRQHYEPWRCPHTPHCPHRAACAIVAMRNTASEWFRKVRR